MSCSLLSRSARSQFQESSKIARRIGELHDGIGISNAILINGCYILNLVVPIVIPRT
jgi:hypothetical protein